MRLYNRIILISLFLMCANLVVFGQNARKTEKPPVSERLFFGGSFGLQFGTITYIDVSPIIGLWILPKVAIAGGPNFTYYKNKYYDEEIIIYGGRLYTQYLLLENINNVLPIGLNTGIFLHLENELSHYKIISPSSENFFANNVLLGGGIRQPVGTRSFLNLTVLWTIHDSGYSIRNNPEIRVSFNF